MITLPRNIKNYFYMMKSSPRICIILVLFLLPFCLFYFDLSTFVPQINSFVPLFYIFFSLQNINFSTYLVYKPLVLQAKDVSMAHLYIFNFPRLQTCRTIKLKLQIRTSSYYFPLLGKISHRMILQSETNFYFGSKIR